MKIRMRVEYGKWKTGHTGKGRFVQRLIPELEQLGCVITESLDEKVDIDFQIARHHYKPENCDKKILRIGPAHVDCMKNHKWLNARKKKALKRSDGVIYQSILGKRMISKFIHKPDCLQTIIYNGAPDTVEKNVRFEVTKSKNYLACAQTWLAQKRLKTILKAFSMLTDATLWVCGNADRDLSKYENVVGLGHVGDDVLRQLYSFCDAHVHLVWLDCMPNSVCESIAAGVPTICNRMSGTAEVVGAAGGVIIDEPEWDNKPVNINKPPKLDVRNIAAAMGAILEYPRPFSGVVDIRNIAKQYHDFFVKVLNGQ